MKPTTPQTVTEWIEQMRADESAMTEAPWRVEEDWTAELHRPAAKMLQTMKFPLQDLNDVHGIVAARNSLRRMVDVIEVAEAEAVKGCAVVHLGYEDGWSCLDIQRHAADPKNAYTKNFRARILAGNHLCYRCVLRKALAALTSGEP